MDSELKLYQQIQTKLAKHPREVQMRTLAWVSNKLHEEYEASCAAAAKEVDALMTQQRLPPE